MILEPRAKVLAYLDAQADARAPANTAGGARPGLLVGVTFAPIGAAA